MEAQTTTPTVWAATWARPGAQVGRHHPHQSPPPSPSKGAALVTRQGVQCSQATWLPLLQGRSRMVGNLNPALAGRAHRTPRHLACPGRHGVAGVWIMSATRQHLTSAGPSGRRAGGGLQAGGGLHYRAEGGEG